MGRNGPLLAIRLRNRLSKESECENLRFSLKNIAINGVKRGCSGFVENADSGVVVYVDTEPSVCGNKLLWRYAESERDYRGYINMWARDEDDLVAQVAEALGVDPCRAMRYKPRPRHAASA